VRSGRLAHRLRECAGSPKGLTLIPAHVRIARCQEYRSHHRRALLIPLPGRGKRSRIKCDWAFRRAQARRRERRTTLMGRTRNGKTRCSEIFARAVCHRAPSSSLPPLSLNLVSPSSLVTLLFPSFSLFSLALPGAISLGNFVYCSRAKSICDSLSRSHAHTRAFPFSF